MDKINKRAIWLILLVIFLLFFPLSSHAQFEWLTYLLGAVFKKYEAGVIFIFFLRLALVVLGWINSLLSDAITKALSPGLMGGWTYTRNPLVDAGLEITGGFISIGLVLALIWIAFATILRLEGHDTGKLLGRLIIIGMLVYFSRVICGLIVDASNIFMYYFTDKIAGVGVFTTTLHTLGQQFVEFLKDVVNPLAWPKRIASCLIVISIQVYTATLLISYLLTFLFRYAAIWIGVILSPVAFICLILPETRKYWERWWKDFISWCLVGPICGFFLYLAARAGEIIEHTPMPGGHTLIQHFANTFNQWDEVARIIPHFFTLGLLQLGVMWGIQATGWGGGMALGLARRATGWATGKLKARKLTPKGLWERAERRVPPFAFGRFLEPIFGKERVERWRRTMEEMAIREATLPPPGTQIPGVRGMVIRGAAAPVWALRRALGRAIGFEPTEKAREAEEAGLKEATGLTVQEQVALFRATSDLNRRLGILRAIIQQGNLRDAMNLAQNALQQQEITALYDVAMRLGREREIIGLYPQQAREHWGPIIPGPIPPDIPPQVHQYGYIVGRMRADDFRNIQEDAIARDEHFVEALIRSDNPEKVSEFINRFGVVGAETIQNVLRNLGQRYHQAPRDYLRANNRRLYAYFTRGGGRGLIQI
jgi:hypothetical protein